MSDPPIFTSVRSTVERARQLRGSTREGRGRARLAMARAQSLRCRVHHVDASVAQATGPTQLNRKINLRNQALDALKESLSDLESVRIVLSGDEGLKNLKADIRETLDRSR